MQIASLEIENFLSYESANLNLADRGLVLVEGENRDQGGSNGAGKTTLFEAICWALFGRVNSGLRGDDIRRFGAGGAGTRVAVSLDVEGRHVEVVRHRAHVEHANTLHLFIDGQDARGASDRDTQGRLGRLLQLDWNSFVSVVLFPQGKQGIAAWTDSEQKTVLDTVLGLGRFGEARARVMTILERDQERIRTLEVDEKMLLQSRDRTKAQIEQLEEKEAGFAEEKKRAVVEAGNACRAHEAIEPEPIEPLQQKLDALRVQLDQSRQDDVLNMIDQLEHEAKTLDKEQAADIAKRDLLRQQGWSVVIDAEAEVAQREACPSCGQDLPEAAIQRLRDTYHRMAQQQEEENIRKQDEVERLDVAVERRSERRQRVQQLLMETREKLQDTSGLEREISELETGINRRSHEIQTWSERSLWLDRQFHETADRVNPYVELIEAERTRLKEAERKLEEVGKELNPLREELGYMEFWKDGFGKAGVKSLLLSTVTPFLNERANVYMDGLSRSTASIRIKTQKAKKGGGFSEKLDFQVNYQNAGGLYAAKSGGEQRRADLSILFALGDLAATRALAPVELRLLDEPFENLDALGCEQVVELLMEHVVPRAKTVLVMSHNEDLKALFEQRIVVVKERGISRIEAA